MGCNSSEQQRLIIAALPFIPLATTMSSPSMANPLPAIPPALFFLVPLFAVVILLLALSHRPAHCAANQPSQKRRALVSYLAIASLTVLSTLTGALGLTASYPSTNSPTPVELAKAKAESVVQAFLFLECKHNHSDLISLIN